MGPFSNDLLPKHGKYFFNSRNLKFDRSDNALQKIKFEKIFYPGYLRQERDFNLCILKDRRLFGETDFRPELNFFLFFICDFDAV